MGNGLITVVVPIYNVERYLNRCIESIVNQTYKELEILLIDDGSPDQCPQMCDEWAKKDCRIRVIHKLNEGLGIARNVGIEHASGEYICFFDSDDYIADDLVEKAYRKICQEEADIVIYGSVTACTKDNIFIAHIPNPAKDVYEGREVLSSFLPEFIGPDPESGKESHLPRGAWAALYRMDLIRRADWRFVSEREIISEDIYSHLVLYKDVRKVAVLREAPYYYCTNEESLSRSYHSGRYEKIKYFYERCVEACRSAGYPDEVARRCMEPFISFTIAALKQEVVLAENPGKAIRKIIDDPVLQQVLCAKKKDKTNLKKRMLFWAIRNKKYSIVTFLLNVRNRLK